MASAPLVLKHDAGFADSMVQPVLILLFVGRALIEDVEYVEIMVVHFLAKKYVLIVLLLIENSVWGTRPR